MTRTNAAAVFFLCAQLLYPAPSGAGIMTMRSLKVFAPGFPRQLSLPRTAPFAVCVSSPGLVSVIDENSGVIAASFPSPAEAFAVSPDGLTVAVVTSTSAITLYSPPSWEPVKTLPVEFPRLAGFSPDGRYFVAGCAADRLYVYRLPAWERYYTLTTGSDGEEKLAGMAFSPDSRVFAAASESGTGIAWDTFAWEKMDDFKAPGAAVKFTYDGKYLSAPPALYTVKDSKVKKAKLPAGEERFLAARLLGPKNLLLAAENGALAVYDADTRAPASPLVAFPGEVSEFELASDGNFLVAASTSAGALYITALGEAAAKYGLAADEGAALFAQGKYEEALKKFLAAKELQNTPDISGKIAEAGYRAAEKRSDAAAAAKRYETAMSEIQAALGYKQSAEGKLKLEKLALKLGSLNFTAMLAQAGALEKKYEYGAAAEKLQEALKIKPDAPTAARARKLAKLEAAAAGYRREYALGGQALKKKDYGAAVELFTKALKFMDTPAARKGLEEAQNNFRR